MIAANWFFQPYTDDAGVLHQSYGELEHCPGLHIQFSTIASNSCERAASPRPNGVFLCYCAKQRMRVDQPRPLRYTRYALPWSRRQRNRSCVFGQAGCFDVWCIMASTGMPNADQGQMSGVEDQCKKTAMPKFDRAQENSFAWFTHE